MPDSHGCQIETILDFLSTNRRKAIEQYVLLMEAEDEADYSEMESIGDNTFVSGLSKGARHLALSPGSRGIRKPGAGTSGAVDWQGEI